MRPGGFEPPTRGLEVRHRRAALLLHDRVDGDERPAELRREQRPEGRLARAHEADEREMAVERGQSSRGQRIRSR
jgi:hypothetical protein